jgi:phage baseplate assembly protein W
MATYNGFSTINANKPRSTSLTPGTGGGYGSTTQPVIPGKKFKLTNEQLVMQDFLNALNIQQGQKVGQPGYGTTLWSFIFEPNTADTQFQLQDEIRRVASSDPRIILNSVKAFPKENGILIEVELAIAPFNNAQVLSVFFNNLTNVAAIQ